MAGIGERLEKLEQRYAAVPGEVMTKLQRDQLVRGATMETRRGILARLTNPQKRAAVEAALRADH